MSKETLLKRIINESIFSLKPYIDAYLKEKLKKGAITEVQMGYYTACDKKMKALIKYFLGGLLIIGLALILLDLVNH